MALKLVTCPETAHLEEIDYVTHPLGLLIEGCSRFQGGCTLSCERTCAARLDRRRRASSQQFDVGELDDE